MMANLRSDDTLVVWRLDRIGVSIKSLSTIVQGLMDRNIGFISLTDGLDTTSREGQMIASTLAAMAKFETDMRSDTTRTGLMAAGIYGRRGGRKKTLDGEQESFCWSMYRSRAMNPSEISRELGVSRATVYRVISRQREAHRAALLHDYPAPAEYPTP